MVQELQATVVKNNEIKNALQHFPPLKHGEAVIRAGDTSSEKERKRHKVQQIYGHKAVISDKFQQIMRV